jgi:hypothetical protein
VNHWADRLPYDDALRKTDKLQPGRALVLIHCHPCGNRWIGQVRELEDGQVLYEPRWLIEERNVRTMTHRSGAAYASAPDGSRAALDWVLLSHSDRPDFAEILCDQRHGPFLLDLGELQRLAERSLATGMEMNHRVGGA